MDNYSVRDYTPGDYKEVVRIWNETAMGGPERGDNQAIIDHSISIGGRLLLLVDQNNKRVIGTSWMTFDGRRIHLHHFGIEPSYQSRGLSKILLKESMNHVRQKGFQVKLEVHQSNTRAINLYKGAGFKYLGIMMFIL
ncbi:MAG: GNAT family N-acetyltransferase [Bacteroidales bacterium]